MVLVEIFVKNDKFWYLDSIWGALGVTMALMTRRKAHGRLPILVIRTFSLSVTVPGL